MAPHVVVDLAPGSTTHLDPATLDPTLLPGLPRVDNQYNEDYTDYANQVHASNHGDFYVPPHMRNGHAATMAPPDTGFIELGSTIAPFAGIMTMSFIFVPPMASFWTRAPIPIGLTNTFACGVPEGGNSFWERPKAFPFGGL